MPFTEFYCRSGGSNLNGGSENGGAEPATAAKYTCVNANWNSGTSVFTPTDGSTPASSIAVGDWASVYLDAATVAVYIARVTAVAAGANGAITLSTTAKAGAAPSTLATGRSIKVGGAWRGPNAGVGFPLSLTAFNNAASNAAGEVPRINLKNDQTYNVTTAVSETFTGGVVQGYTTTPGDGGKVTFTTGNPSINILLTVGIVLWADLIFDGSNQNSGSATLVQTNAGSGGSIFFRCVAKGSRGVGFAINTIAMCVECEAYDCNRSNSAGMSGFQGNTTGVMFVRCISHDNTGSNSAGFIITSSSQSALFHCIADTNGGVGFSVGASGTCCTLQHCDAYNNTSHGMSISNNKDQNIFIHSCNLVKNGGWGINFGNVLTPAHISNCGYGTGSQANASGTTNNTGGFSINTVTYASGVTPWVDPANGDFRINLAAAISAGRGAYTQTAASYAGAVGAPDIGAVQALVSAAAAVKKSSFVFGG